MAYFEDLDLFNRIKFREGRYRHFGACVASEYYQMIPYFFTREGATIPLVGEHRGGSAFLLASGPSFNECDKELLKQPGVWVMTLNNAVASFRGNASCIVDDPSRFTLSMWLDPKIQKFVPMSAFEKPLWDNRLIALPNGQYQQMWQPANIKVGDCPNVVGYRRNEKFVAARYLYEDTINWGNHKKWGGGRSVMLAAMRILFLMGFRNVYLLGVDFEMSEEKRYHFPEERHLPRRPAEPDPRHALQHAPGGGQPVAVQADRPTGNGPGLRDHGLHAGGAQLHPREPNSRDPEHH